MSCISCNLQSNCNSNLNKYLNETVKQYCNFIEGPAVRLKSKKKCMWITMSSTVLPCTRLKALWKWLQVAFFKLSGYEKENWCVGSCFVKSSNKGYSWHVRFQVKPHRIFSLLCRQSEIIATPVFALKSHFNFRYNFFL